MKTLLETLTDQYEKFNKDNGLNLGSADEHLHDEHLTQEQRDWLRGFCQRWERAEDADRNAHANPTNARACLENFGFSYEYPGFLLIDANGYDFTVGDGSGGLDTETKADAELSVQIMTSDGGNVENVDVAGVQGVLAHLEDFTKRYPRVEREEGGLS